MKLKLPYLGEEKIDESRCFMFPYTYDYDKMVGAPMRKYYFCYFNNLGSKEIVSVDEAILKATEITNFYNKQYQKVSKKQALLDIKSAKFKTRGLMYLASYLRSFR